MQNCIERRDDVLMAVWIDFVTKNTFSEGRAQISLFGVVIADDFSSAPKVQLPLRTLHFANP